MKIKLFLVATVFGFGCAKFETNANLNQETQNSEASPSLEDIKALGSQRGILFNFEPSTAFVSNYPTANRGSDSFIVNKMASGTVISALSGLEEESGAAKLLAVSSTGPVVNLPYAREYKGSQVLTDFRPTQLTKVQIKVVVDKPELLKNGFKILTFKSKNESSDSSVCEQLPSALNSPLSWSFLDGPTRYVNGDKSLRGDVVLAGEGLRSTDGSGDYASISVRCEETSTKKFSVIAEVFVHAPVTEAASDVVSQASQE